MAVAVLLIGKVESVDDAGIDRILTSLSKNGYSVRAPENLRACLAKFSERFLFLPEDALFEGADLALVLGGDGSVLRAARQTAAHSVPLAGINYGRLGYLTALDRDEPELLEELLNGQFRVEERVMLDVAVGEGDSLTWLPYPALNEVVVSNAPMTEVLAFELLCNGIPTQKYRSDGMIIATPSGSTAYSLSAGGPVVSPSLDCILATPLCPHSLASRPVVFDGDTVLELRHLRCRKNTLYLSLDGFDPLFLGRNDRVVVRRSERKTKLLRPRSDSFLNTLYQKITNPSDFDGGNFDESKTTGKNP